MNKIWLAVGCSLILAGVILGAVSMIDEKQESTNYAHWLTLEMIDPYVDRSPYCWRYFQRMSGSIDRIDPFIYRSHCCEHILIDLSIESAVIIHCEVDLDALWVTVVESEDPSFDHSITIYNFTLGNAGTYFIGVDGERHLRIEIKTRMFHLEGFRFDTSPYAPFLPTGMLFVILGAVYVCVYLDRSRRTRTDKPSLQT